jgi:glycolate oxidase iron-sulfur subunit
MAGRILAEKMDNLLSVEPELVVTANPGCQMQLLAGIRSRGRQIPVKHLAELLADAY